MRCKGAWGEGRAERGTSEREKHGCGSSLSGELTSMAVAKSWKAHRTRSARRASASLCRARTSTWPPGLQVVVGAGGRRDSGRVIVVWEGVPWGGGGFNMQGREGVDETQRSNAWATHVSRPSSLPSSLCGQDGGQGAPQAQDRPSAIENVRAGGQVLSWGHVALLYIPCVFVLALFMFLVFRRGICARG